MVALCKYHPPWHQQRLLTADRQLALRGQPHCRREGVSYPTPGTEPGSPDVKKDKGLRCPFIFGGRCWGGQWVGEVIPLTPPLKQAFLGATGFEWL